MTDTTVPWFMRRSTVPSPEKDEQQIESPPEPEGIVKLRSLLAEQDERRRERELLRQQSLSALRAEEILEAVPSWQR